MSSNLVASAGLKDGLVAVFDMRAHQAIFKQKVHSGSVNLLHITEDGLLVSGAADGSVKAFQIAKNPQPVAEAKSTHAVICGQVCQNMILTGNGDGNI